MINIFAKKKNRLASKPQITRSKEALPVASSKTSVPSVHHVTQCWRCKTSDKKKKVVGKKVVHVAQNDCVGFFLS